MVNGVGDIGELLSRAERAADRVRVLLDGAERAVDTNNAVVENAAFAAGVVCTTVLGGICVYRVACFLLSKFWGAFSTRVPPPKFTTLPLGDLVTHQGKMYWRYRTQWGDLHAPINSFAEIPGFSDAKVSGLVLESARRESLPVPREAPGSQVLIYYDITGPMPDGMVRRMLSALVGKPAKYELLGTGYVMGGRLVTAGHVVRDALDGKLSLALASAKNPSTVFALPRTAIVWDRPYCTDGDELRVYDLPVGFQSRLGVSNAKVRPPRSNEMAYVYSGAFAGQAASVHKCKGMPLTWLHGCSTERGDSGAPVLGRDNFVIGMHVGAKPEGNIFIDVASLVRAIHAVVGVADKTAAVSDDPLFSKESNMPIASYARIPEDVIQLLPEKEKRTALVSIGGQSGLAILGEEGYGGRDYKVNWADMSDLDDAQKEVEDLVKYDASLDEVLLLSGAEGDKVKTALVTRLYTDAARNKRNKGKAYEPESKVPDFRASEVPAPSLSPALPAQISLGLPVASTQTTQANSNILKPLEPAAPSIGRRPKKRNRQKKRGNDLSSPALIVQASSTMRGPQVDRESKAPASIAP